jgi:macrolide transport system ATP-binding/permease protein
VFFVCFKREIRSGGIALTLISCHGINKSFGDLNVLQGINLDINKGDRMGLVGSNGAGKSTLANIIFGKTQPDSGFVNLFQKNLKVGYLMQSTAYTANTFQHMAQLEHNHDMMSGFLEASSILGLRKVNSWKDERYNHLSGGERTKLALAHIWASAPELLILDEPTNHLDFYGVEWLVSELEKFQGTVIVISHDRYFLDQVVLRIIELTDGSTEEYLGNYTFYREEKTQRYNSQLHQYNIQKKAEEKIAAEIARLENWSAKAHREAGKVGKMAEMRAGVKEFYRTKAKKMDQQIKSRIHRLQKIETEGIQKPKEEQEIIIDFTPPQKRGRRILEVNQLVKKHGERLLFNQSTFYIQRGDKIGVFGPNGIGKTTLLQIILGSEKPDQGDMWVSPSAKIAYLSQDVGDLNSEKTVLEQIEISDRTKTQTMLANMGFDETMLRKPINQLSLGERTRVKIAKLILQENDFLILDEPTNHLDLQSREQLENTLSEYKGTILLVSHDRYMLERICDKMLVFEQGRIVKRGMGFNELMSKPGKPKKDQKLIIENRMAYLIGQMSKYTANEPEYIQLDHDYKDLLQQLREM